MVEVPEVEKAKRELIKDTQVKLEGYLHQSVSGYLVVVDDHGAIEIDDTLRRSDLLGRRVKIVAERILDLS